MHPLPARFFEKAREPIKIQGTEDESAESRQERRYGWTRRKEKGGTKRREKRKKGVAGEG